jgi:hypothetical protein
MKEIPGEFRFKTILFNRSEKAVFLFLVTGFIWF